MQKVLAIFMFLAGFALTLVAQGDNARESLIAVHYDDDHKAEIGQAIYQYDFTNGVFTGRSLVMTLKGRVNNQEAVRLDMGENLLYRERYLISTAGDIVDLKDRKVLYDGSSRLVYCRNDSVVMYTNDAFKGKYYAYYNLKTNAYAEIKSLTYKAIIGQDIEFDKRQSPYKIFLYPVNKPKVLLLDDAGSGGERSPDPPLCWIDENTFIFVNAGATGNEGSVVKYAVSTKTKTLLGTFTMPGKPGFPGGIYQNKKGTYNFEFNTKVFEIDPVKNTVAPLNKIALGDRYEADTEDKSAGRSIYSQGKEIGKYHCGLNGIKSSPRYLALVKQLVVGGESYQQGIAVWDDVKQQWQNIDAEEVASLAGWIKQ